MKRHAATDHHSSDREKRAKPSSVPSSSSSSLQRNNQVKDEIESETRSPLPRSNNREQTNGNTCSSDSDARDRLRAIACLRARLDLLDSISELDRTFELLHNQLCREQDPHVAQQLVRIIASMAISGHKLKQGNPESDQIDNVSCLEPKSKICLERPRPVIEINLNESCVSLQAKDLGDERHRFMEINLNESITNPESNISSERQVEINLNDSPDEIPSPEFKHGVRYGGFPLQYHSVLKEVKALLSYLSGTCLHSISLKLQLLRSLQFIALETGMVRSEDMIQQIPKLLTSTCQLLRANALEMFATVLIKDCNANFPPENEDCLNLFEEYTRDTSVVVRRVALNSILLLCTNGYTVTKACYTAASTLLDDPHETVRCLALNVINLWVEKEPEQWSNEAFIQVCKLIIDMKVSVRVEACKVFCSMTNIREELLLQALSKQPLELTVKHNGSSQASLITMAENELDISTCEQGLNILDRLNMGAFVHAVEDEFHEVRALAVKALASLINCSSKCRIAILEVMFNLLSDESEDVRVNVLHALINVTHEHELLVKDSDIHILHATLEDIDDNVRYLGMKLIESVRLPSTEAFKSTTNTLIKYKQAPQRDILCTLYRLGKNNSMYVLMLSNDLLNELRQHLTGDVGLDSIHCAAILTLFVAASESDASFIPLISTKVLSMGKLLSYKLSSLEVDSIGSETQLFRLFKDQEPGTHGISGSMAQKGRMEELLTNTIRTACDVKTMLDSGMINSVKRILSCCRKDIKSLVHSSEHHAAMSSFVLRYLECISLLCQGWAHFHVKSHIDATFSELSSKLEYVVNSMLHSYAGHATEQRVVLLELSVFSSIWRIALMPGDTLEEHTEQILSRINSIESIGSSGSYCTPFIRCVKDKLLKRERDSRDPVLLRHSSHELAASFWAKPIPVSNSLKELKSYLSFPGIDLHNPLQYMPGLPLCIEANIVTCNSGKDSRIWVRTQLSDIWTTFIFLDSEESTVLLEIQDVQNISKCTLKVVVLLECPGVIPQIHYDKGPRGFLVPLSAEKEIHLRSSIDTNM